MEGLKPKNGLEAKVTVLVVIAVFQAILVGFGYDVRSSTRSNGTQIQTNGTRIQALENLVSAVEDLNGFAELGARWTLENQMVYQEVHGNAITVKFDAIAEELKAIRKDIADLRVEIERRR